MRMRRFRLMADLAGEMSVCIAGEARFGMRNYQQSLREWAGAINQGLSEDSRGYDGRARCCCVEVRSRA